MFTNLNVYRIGPETPRKVKGFELEILGDTLILHKFLTNFQALNAFLRVQKTEKFEEKADYLRVI